MKLAGKIFESRLLLGTAAYPNLHLLEQALRHSGAQIATVALRRVNVHEKDHDGILKILQEGAYTLLPNTAGCFSAKEAILTAKLSREALGTNWIKLEVIGDSYSLYPDSEELLQAARQLVKEGFEVFPYCNDDPVLCKKLQDAGCAVVMPLGAPIGSGQGIRNPYNLELIRRAVSIPVIVDAGIGLTSHACQAMELGMDGILLNTAVAKAKDPVKMARAMKAAIEAGRMAFEAGPIPSKKMATPSSPEVGRMDISNKMTKGPYEN